MPLEVGTVSTEVLRWREISGFLCRNALRSRDSFNERFENLEQEILAECRNALRSRDSFNLSY